MSTIATIGSMALEQAQMRSRVDVISRQVSTGQRGAVHGDLGLDARRAIDLKVEIAKRESFTDAADRALARADAAQTVLGRLHDLASNVAAEALRARTLGAVAVTSLADIARAALEEAAALLNTRHGGEYLFAGSDVTNPPVPDAATITTGPMATAIAASVATLDPTNAATVLADTQAIATDPATTPFSDFLEGDGTTEARRALQVSDGERVAIGVFANRDSTDEVTASWGRELLRGLAVLASVDQAQFDTGEGWQDLLEGTTEALNGAVGGLSAEQGKLGAAYARIDATRERHEDMLVVLRTQLGDVAEVDLAQVSAELAQVRERLEASYTVTTMISRLSLASMLG
ncbi:flagellin [Falsiroseomonas ponticola]|uniref:flagellin n=1 Tax=Falsiroseomonas ponticola TaxID=2786951 RepID=UPI001933CA7C|nr:flagellin [Roseomonas ponticola]